MSIFIMNFKRNMKGAFKTVKSNFKEYICFFLALIMVELLFGVITISFQNNRKVQESIIQDAGYTYHAYVLGARSEDTNILRNAYNRALASDEVYFTIINQEKMQVLFKGDLKNARSRFTAEVIDQINESSVRVALIVTPLYSHHVSLGEDIPGFIALLVLLMGLSFLLLMALFRIRINHFKFTYSIYMAFGGDFKKLTQSAFYEVLLIALLSFLPALPLTYLISALLYLPFGQPFGFYPLSLLLMLVLPLICSLLALLLPMRVLALGVPTKLMKAQDNSNYLRSVRKSKIFLKRSPLYIEGWALWRFRSYIALLLLSTVSFAILFNAGCYLADVYAVRVDKAKADITLSLNQNANYDHFAAFLDVNCKKLNLGGYVLEKTAADPYADVDDSYNSDGVLRPHIAIPTNRIESGAYTVCPGNEKFSATDVLEIRPYDEDSAKCFDDIYAYEYEGDPSLLLTDPDTVIVSTSLANKKANSIKPGDTVMLPVDYVRKSGVEIYNENGISTFEQRLSGYVYTYRAFKVAAVVTNYSDYTNMLVYLPTVSGEERASGYRAVMGCEPDYSKIQVHMENSDNKELFTKLVQNYISNAGASCGISIDMDYGSMDEKITAGKNSYGMILVLSCLVFAVSPIAGFFSQILFYQKRHLEFDVLRAVGATAKDLKAIFLTDGAVLAALSGITYALGTVGIIHLLCKILNSPLVFGLFSDGKASVFYPTIMPIPFLVGLVLTVLFSFLQVFLCAWLYQKRTNDHIAADFTQVDEI
ncbi:MAG: hypothetical protein IJ344_00325 [Clostridia bacterium]|nr:hypothetical protein [Clostridia bacterium]